MLDKLDEDYWSQRYRNEQTGWDIGQLSPPLKHYIDQISQKSLSILIPGSGNAYEAAYLMEKGFYNTHILDISEWPLNQFKKQSPDFPANQVLHKDFFALEGSFDLIFEQTFFCALKPDLRPQYVEKMLNLLKGGGKLVGLLFDDPLYDDHPPFGGSKGEYLALFRPHFDIHTFEKSYNSIKARRGRELFMILQKPKN
ncbi:SAM-dependent methyltransferase [Catalinimonas alkaloidigena]|uniref:methyltransferase domain-containing protein n=1 Tax=Catalinimonas alkaloidigena TaxID=1075417 RepID=UPI002406F742|nr:methyltransferase domain-containing protein [Catalinimonas alkaloidigena]MDF9796724.1 SAM-dependent methyltransferase [Catalinimonas alkaloidigena]